jgi:WD40 repeat protein
MNLAHKKLFPRVTGLFFLVCWSAACADENPRAPQPGGPLPVAELKREMPVDFERELLPALKNSCLACHNTTKAKSGLNLETPQLMLMGGDSGPAAVPGKGAESLVFKAAAHLDSELIMPPKDNKANALDLSPEHLALLKLWIDQGARGEVHTAEAVAWLKKPPQLDPIFAVALTQDGQFAACGRGNRIDLYHVPSGQLAARLSDTNLVAAGFTNAAHHDLVNALAFNPDGTLLASGGYRELKLWRRWRQAQKIIPALANLGSSFAVSPDHRWVAALSTNHAIALVEAVSGRVAHLLTGHSNAVTSIRFSPSGARLCSGSADGTVRVWNAADGALVAFAEVSSEVRAIAWLGGDTRCASGGDDGVVRVWQVPSSTTLELLQELKAGDTPITTLEGVPDSQQLLSGSADGIVRQWNVAEGKVLREWNQGSAVSALAVRADGKRFASAGTNNLAKLLDTADGKPVAELKGDRYAYEQVHETERGLVVAQGDVAFRKKSLETAEADFKKQTERVAKANETNAVTGKILAEKSNALKDAQAAKEKSDKALTDLLAEIKTVTERFEKAEKAAKEAATTAKAVTAKATETQLALERATISKSDAERIATDTASVAVKTKAAVNNADAAKETAKRIAEESAAVAEKSKAFAEAVTADAEMKTKLAAEARVAAEKIIEEVSTLAFAAGQLKPGYDKTLAEAPEKRKQATNQVETATKALASAEQEFKRAATRNSVTGHELELAQQAAVRASNTVSLAKAELETADSRQRDIESNLERFKKIAAASEQPIRALAFSPDGLTLASTGDDGMVHTWSAETGAAFEVFAKSRAAVSPAQAQHAVNTSERNAAFPPEGGAGRTLALLCFLDAHTLLTASADGAVAWDIDPVWTLERRIGTGDMDSPFSDRVNAVRFSPNGQTLATGSGEPTRSGEIKFWNVADGVLRNELKNVHSDAVLSLDFSADGRYFASSSADRFVRVVELATGKVVKAFEGHTSYVLGVSWKRDSRTLASAGADNVIKVWDFTTGERKKNIDGAGKEVTSIAFVGVTDQALATSGDGQVRLFRENGEKIRSFEGAADFVNCAAATPDGSTIVAGGQDGTLRIWDGADGKLRASFAAPATK